MNLSVLFVSTVVTAHIGLFNRVLSVSISSSLLKGSTAANLPYSVYGSWVGEYYTQHHHQEPGHGSY
jgi:hypothetical protein